MWRPEPGPWTPTDQPSASGLGGTGGHVAGALTPFPCREHCWGARSPQGTIRTLAMCCSNEAPSGPARGPLGGQAAGVGAWPDQQRLPVGTSQPPRAQEPGTQSPPWVTLSFIQQQRQCGEQGVLSQEPLNRSQGQEDSETQRGVCVRSEARRGPLLELQGLQRGVSGGLGCRGGQELRGIDRPRGPLVLAELMDRNTQTWALNTLVKSPNESRAELPK